MIAIMSATSEPRRSPRKPRLRYRLISITVIGLTAGIFVVGFTLQFGGRAGWIPAVLLTALSFSTMFAARLNSAFLQFVLSSAAGLFAFLSVPRYVESTEFYKASAAALPVLLLAIVIDRRRDFSQTQNLLARATSILSAFATVAAGISAFQVLAVDNTSVGWANLVGGALAQSSTALLL